MRTKRIVLTAAVSATAITISLLLITAFASAQPAAAPLSPQSQGAEDTHAVAPAYATQAVSVTFPPGDWPWYAEQTISVHPEPAIAEHPTEICAEVINEDPVHPHVAILEFGVTHFGIGVPFTHVGEVAVEVPPGDHAQGCVVWVPPEDGHWCIEVFLTQLGEPEVQRRQRNIDIWEPLVPGMPHEMVFPVGPLPVSGTVTFTLDSFLPGWDVQLNPPDFFLLAGTEQTVTLTTVPSPGIVLGSREPVVDIEGFLDGETIGGFRKMDMPPVPLHRPMDPFFAESEISVWPYPPRAGEPTEICVELFNLSDQPQIVEVEFSWANFGIGLPFDPIGGPIIVEIPPWSHQTVCTWWIPPFAGHFCVQVQLDVVGGVPYETQFSQLNLDVAEPLMPGVPHTIEFPVGNFFNEFTNPEPMTTDIQLETEMHQPGWIVEIVPPLLPAMLPGEIRVVSMTVTPPPNLPPPGSPVVDVIALADPLGEPYVIGGFRKIFRPPIPLHFFPDPPYAEREISVHPYPTLVGEPTEICVELYNPTPEFQEVVVEFSWANFGIGLPFTPINGPRVVHIPPHSTVHECIHWIPPVSGHVCLQVELFIEGHEPQRSQRNIDIDEPLEPGVPHTRFFPVGNPFDHIVDIELGFIPLLHDWMIELSPDFLPGMDPGEVREVALTVIPPPGVPLPPDGEPIVDVEAYAEGELIGGFRKVFRPPIPLHPFPDPPYAEREISVHPYPTLVGEPTEICVELRNPTPYPQDVVVEFSWAHFGIGLPFTPINGPRVVHLPPYSIVRECIHWIPPVSGHLCLQVELFIEGHEPQRSQRNIDVDEPLEPGVPHTRFFPVGNPFDHPVDIELGFIPLLHDWMIELTPDFLLGMNPGEVREVALTVVPPPGVPLPPDEEPVVDVEAFAEGELIGGFRKIFRPPVPIHRPHDPIYAESEIFVHPYPPRAHEPTELSVEIRNPTDEWQTVTVIFSVAPFGIGLPFEPVNEPIVVHVPPHGMVWPGTIWLPPEGGLWCIQVEVIIPGHDEIFFSQRNIDVGEPLEPLVPHARPFLVGNPLSEPVSITLGLIPHFPDWGLELLPYVLPNMAPGEVREVILTVTPPADLPADGDPIVDVEAFVEGELIGGFRKIFRPPVPIHRPHDPIYAESEIFVDPYPFIPGVPTMLGVEVFNPTDEDRTVTATFSIAPFGIGLPFSTTHIVPNPIHILVPQHGAAHGHVTWMPPEWHGKFCVRVTLEMEGHEPIWSQRNIDVGEPLEPGVPHELVFPVGSWPHTAPATITLGLIRHQEGWTASLSENELTNVQPGQVVSMTLTVTPPHGILLGSGDPIVDVEAFVEGEIIGGFRKLDVPPVPIHKPHEKGYAESEISIDPYPPQLGQETHVSTVVYNTGEETVTVELEFGWAKFGMGIPFSTTGMVPYTRTVTLRPEMMVSTTVTWTPVYAGPQCIRILLSDPDDMYEPQESMRNVDVMDGLPCDEPLDFYVIIYNDTPVTVTVDIGMITFDWPADWIVTTVPSDTMELGPFSEGLVTVTVVIPCPPTTKATREWQEMHAMQQQAGGVPTVDVEGYVDGELVGGIELRFLGDIEIETTVYLPVILKNW